MIDFLENSIEEANIIFPEIKEFYQSYLEHGGKKTITNIKSWLNRRTMGPNDKEDLLIFGKVISSKLLYDECDYIHEELNSIRSARRLLGKQLSRIIASCMLGHEKLDEPLTMAMWEEIREHLYNC